LSFYEFSFSSLYFNTVGKKLPMIGNIEKDNGKFPGTQVPGGFYALTGTPALLTFQGLMITVQSGQYI
jgi:hypothetical protein